MISIDTFRRIGASHIFCEDYVLSGTTPFNYIIISDGCSSAKNTEMGSRILCYIARQFLLYRFKEYVFPNLDYDDMGNWIIHNAELTARQLGLSRSCLNATLIIAFEHEGKYYIYMYGDGLCILKNKDIVNIMKVDFKPLNAPFYLQYRINPLDMDKYHKMGQVITINHTIIKLDTGNKSDLNERQYAYDYKAMWDYNIDDFPTLLICSDGASSFYKNDDRNDIVPLEIIAKEFLNYKLTKGEFLKRRLKRMLKIYDKEGTKHDDDLTVGAFLKED